MKGAIICQSLAHQNFIRMISFRSIIIIYVIDYGLLKEITSEYMDTFL